MDGEIVPEEVKRALNDDDAPLIVDIRSPAAFKQGHLPDSRNIPFGDLPAEVESLTDAEHIVTVCPHGKASVQAAQMIGSYEGIENTRIDSMAGGISEWPGELAEAEPEPQKTDEAEEGEQADAPF